jgi:MFS family permease
VNVLEAVAPARLGRSFRWLLCANAASNLGDGFMIAAGPLLVASKTHNPVLVAAAVFFQQLPWLVFGVFAGALVDRIDRRHVVMAVDLARAAVLLVLAAAIVTGTVSIAVVLATMFVLGTAETFADVAGSTLLPSTVDKADIGIGNARIQGSGILTNQMAGPPIGAFLFAVGRAVPFGATAACFVVAAVLVSRVALRPREEHQTLGSVRGDIVVGVRWLWRHPPVRTLALTIVSFNVTFGAAWSVLVLWSTQRLGMDASGFGLLTTAVAVGGIIGTTSYGWLEKRFSLANLMRACLLTETFVHLSLALVDLPALALVVMVVFGVEAFVWGTTSTTVRQRAVPIGLLGRVTSVYMIGTVAGLLVGTAVGGPLAHAFGLTAPFWFGFFGSGVLLACIWRELGHIAHAGDPS